MSSQRFAPEFKEEAVRQVVERGYSVPDVAARLGVSAHSLYKWVTAASPDRSEQQSKELLEARSEILRLRSEMRRVEEERDLLKTYGPPRLQGCRLVGMIGLHQRIRSQGLALAKMDIRASRVLIKATASGAAFMTRITEPPV